MNTIKYICDKCNHGDCILIVEDEAVIALLIEQTLLSNGYAVSSVATTGPDAMAEALSFREEADSASNRGA